MSFERPRVRTDGPGGPDVKQGARIACLDCRTAKIRCSAPTDGKVPCKRCSRHGKDCVFEKHRRGRKPGRANSSNPYASSGGVGGDGGGGNGNGQQAHYYKQDERANYRRGGETSYSSGSNYQDIESPYRSHPHPSYQSSQSGPGSESQHNWSPSSTSSQGGRFAHVPSSGMKSVSPTRTHQDFQPNHSRLHSTHALLSASREAASRELHTTTHPSYLPSLHSHTSSSPILSTHAPPPPPLSPRRQGGNGAPFGLNLGPIVPSFGMGTSASSASGLSPSGGMSSRMTSLNTPLSMPRFNFIDHQLTPGGMVPSSTLAPSGTPSKSWLDFPSPGSRSLFSPSRHGLLTSSIPPPTLSGTSSAPYWPGAAVTSSSHSSQKRKPAGDYFSGVLPSPRISPEENRQDDNKSEGEGSAKKRRLEKEEAEEDGTYNRMRSSTRELEDDQEIIEDEEEEVDQLDEDEVGGESSDDVLSTPLSLLAHASDAAATLKEGYIRGQRRDSGSKRMGAATMGLVSPPIPRLAPPRRWFDSGRLPNLGPRMSHSPSQSHQSLTPVIARPPLPDYARGSSTSRSSSMAPPFGPLSRPTPLPSSLDAYRTSPPPNLSAIGRSRSYTTVETVNRIPSTFSPPQAGVESGTREPTRSVVTETERRAEVLGEGVIVSGKSLKEVEQQGNSIAPSTLDHDAWEYRDGRARTRKSFSAASSGPGTTMSEESAKQGVSANDQSSSKSSSNGVRVSADQAVVKKLEAVFGKEEEIVVAVQEVGKTESRPRRWQTLRLRIGKKQDGETEKAGSDDGTEAESEESENLGASHQDFFSLSIFHSKMDNEADMDPVQEGLVELREVEKLFDIFFARINPLLNLLDPFLHRVNYVRNRSALLTTVIDSLAARLSDNGRDAELAVTLERFWRQKLLPEVLLGGYKSVELSQAFLILSLYHKSTNRLADDRSWQYLGFAIRIATEVGVNRTTQPSESVRENEQVRRRMRNRARLWINLFLCDRALSFQTGRPWTVLEDEMITHSSLWHREDFALPEDTRLVGSIKLTRLVGEYSKALKDVVGESQATSHLSETSIPFKWKEEAKELIYCLSNCTAELERWRDVWCAGSLEDRPDGSQTQAVANSLDRWQSGAKRRYYYARLNSSSRALQSLERIRSLQYATAEAKGNLDQMKPQMEEIDGYIEKISIDAWQSSLDMIATLLEPSEQNDLSAAPNQLAVMSTYAALAALRLTTSQQKMTAESGLDQKATLSCCKSLTEALIEAGNTPKHRNSAAATYGVYLQGIITVWESDVIKATSSTIQEPVVKMNAEQEGSDVTAAATAAAAPSVAAVARVDAGEGKPQNKDGNVQQVTLLVDDAKTKSIVTTSDLQIPLMTPLKEVTPPYQQHSVGDEIWGNSFSHADSIAPPASSMVSSDPEAIDRMWDYLTTYPDPSNGFPLSLWQPHSNWTGPPTVRTPNVAHTSL